MGQKNRASTEFVGPEELRTQGDVNATCVFVAGDRKHVD